MAPKRNPSSTTKPSPSTPNPPSANPPHSTSTSTSPTARSSSSSIPTPTPSRPSKSSSSSSSTTLTPRSTATEILTAIWNNYVSRTPQRVKLLDTFMAFLVLVGVLQFVYCVGGGNYPFNAFLSGFSATVGQFVLTASLRIQTNAENRAEFKAVSHERAFADYVFGSLILHFFCVNFIN